MAPAAMTPALPSALVAMLPKADAAWGSWLDVKRRTRGATAPAARNLPWTWVSNDIELRALPAIWREPSSLLISS